MAIEEPDMNAWLAQAKESEQAPNIGMFLIHNGIVRATPRHAVRAEAARPAEAPERDARVVAVDFSYDKGLKRRSKKHLVGKAYITCKRGSTKDALKWVNRSCTY